MEEISIERKVFKGVSWLATFKLLSQIFSWAVTIAVARMLVPGDYGLMEMATVITGYAMIFSELGLGSAIIHKPKLTQNELSSLFWFLVGFSIILSIGAYFASYPTAYIFNEPRVIPVTKSVSILFMISGFQILPLALLNKELEFKKVGLIELIGVIFSSVAMYLLAFFEAGVWTLIGGHIIRNFTKLCILYYVTKWRPIIHFSFKEIKEYLKFGLTISAGRSLYYIYDKSDKFFAGRVWSAGNLGLYSFSLQLAKIPTDKIATLINQVSFPAFSKLQNDKEKFNQFYLNIVNVTAAIILPVFVGLYLVGDEVVKTFLNEKWYPIISLFKILCLAQIVTSINAVNNFVHAAQGRPAWSLCFNMVMALVMPISFYLMINTKSLFSILIPWLTTYIIFNLLWIYITLKKIDIHVNRYLKTIWAPLSAVTAMAICLTLSDIYLFNNFIGNTFLLLIIKSIIGGLIYIVWMYLFDRNLLSKLFLLLKDKKSN